MISATGMPMSSETAAHPAQIKPAPPLDASTVSPKASVVDPKPVQKDALDEVLQRAAEAKFSGRKVDVKGFTDEATGRFVVRIADRDSGEVLTQTPPEPLLRFYANLTKDLDALLAVEA